MTMRNSQKSLGLSNYQVAGAAEILRAAQKDEQYLSCIRNLVAELAQRCYGMHHWLKWRDKYGISSDFIYFMVTTVSGYQTLGEEYVHIVQVDHSVKQVPSQYRRLLSVILHTSGPFMLQLALSHLEKKLKEGSNPHWPAILRKENVQKQLLNLFPVIRKCITYFQKLHLVIFYFSGTFYDFSKRFTGIKFVLLRRWLAESTSQKAYKILGWITAIQLCLSLALHMCAFYVTSCGAAFDYSSNREDKEVSNILSKNRCCLCLEKRNNSTATPCGHLYCWACITDWMQNKHECPLCREKFLPTRLMYLQNYD